MGITTKNVSDFYAEKHNINGWGIILNSYTGNI